MDTAWTRDQLRGIQNKLKGVQSRDEKVGIATKYYDEKILEIDYAISMLEIGDENESNS